MDGMGWDGTPQDHETDTDTMANIHHANCDSNTAQRTKSSFAPSPAPSPAPAPARAASSTSVLTSPTSLRPASVAHPYPSATTGPSYRDCFNDDEEDDTIDLTTPLKRKRHVHAHGWACHGM